jgi:spoIIIJ-associated protein
MSEPVEVDATGETVGEAKWNALRELERMYPGLDKAAVSFEILSEGERGLLGVGYAPARVLATAPAVALAVVEPSELGAVAADARELVERITAALEVECRIDVSETDETVTVSCTGRDLGVLIGRHGQTIDAVQYVANAIAFRAHGDGRKEVVVDAAGYQARRRELLESLAHRTAERVRRSGEAVALEPMSATERKIVHTRLADAEGIETSSEGSEPARYVVVRPA